MHTSTAGAALQKNEPLFKKLFWGSLVFMLGFFWTVGYDTGFNSDEMDMNVYGKANIAYYTSGGKDTTFLHPSHNDGVGMAPTLPYYGSGFEYFASGLTALIGDHYEYNTRHLLNQFVAVIGLLFTGLIARRVKGYRAALISIWLLFLTPIFNGQALFNTKDIPFLTAYMACLYYTQVFFDNPPKSKWNTLIQLCFWMWLLLSIRIGGLLVIAYIVLYALLEYRQNEAVRSSAKEQALKLGAAVALAFLLMVITWPFLLQDPAEHIGAAVNVLKNFPQKIEIAFEGEFTDSLNLPGNYLPKIFSLTVPAVMLVLLFATPVLLILVRKQLGSTNTVVLMTVAALFPAIYALYTHMPLYNSWRHLLFIYPPMAVLVAVALAALAERIQKPVVSWLLAGAVAIGFFHPVRWTLQNIPYQYTYYNEISGGFNKTYYEYETEYWQISVKEAIDWLMKHEPILQSKDTQVIATNAYSFSYYYFKKRYPTAKVRVQRLGDKTNFAAQGVYTIFNTLFLDPFYLEHCYPSPYTIHTIDIDQRPVTYVAKDTNQFVHRGYNAFQKADYKTADSFFALYLRDIRYKGHDSPETNTALSMVAFSRLATNHQEDAYKIAKKSILSFPNDYLGYVTVGIIHFNAKQFKEARAFLSKAYELKPNDNAAKTYLDMIPN